MWNEAKGKKTDEKIPLTRFPALSAINDALKKII